MKLSNYFAPTLKEAPAEAEIISHKLLIRAGMIRKTAAGIYSFLPLGKRVLAKVEKIIREEMNAAGAQEVLMPVLQPSELWQKSGRWDKYGPEMMRLKDRNEREFALGPTHEELITTIVASEVRSYKDLPLNLYQIQVKFRDEIRPRFGLLRGREFIMKDAYSFHTSADDMKKTYSEMSKAYSNIAERSGLQFRIVQADSGLIGGDITEEFMALSSAGEDLLLYCQQCDYGANVEEARALHIAKESKEKQKELEPVSTPGKSSIEDVSDYLKIEKHSLAKTLVYLCDSEPVLVILPGDREANEIKIAKALGCRELRLFEKEDFEKFSHLISGFVGPVNAKNKILADEEITRTRNMVTGANQPDVHYLNVNYERDFNADIVDDIKFARAGDFCPSCQSVLESAAGIEIGQIFQLGTRYSKTLGANYLDKEGKSQPIIMGTYGIGVTRLLAATVEQNHDDKGIIWPRSIAPFEIVIVQTDMKEEKLNKKATELYKTLSKQYEVIYDDRDERAGVKFADADLIGYPLQIIIGKTLIEQDMIELKVRANHKKEIVASNKVIDKVEEIFPSPLTGDH